jgi:2-keto-3-deoxy-L-fuconate dehydrogenase
MKNVMISGGSSGIGLATVERFSQAGFQVFILDIQKFPKELPNVHFIACDVSQIADIQKAVKHISQNNTHINALVCNTGVHFSATILETNETDYNYVMDTNFKSAFFLTQAVLPLMLSQKKGAIVFVGSDQTLIGKHNSAIYGATKAALGSLAKTTALDYAEQGIRANVVAAGTINTPLYHHAIEKYCKRTAANAKEIHRLEAKEQPLGRIGEPQEVANLIYFLCSDEASFMTGGTIAIDGGYTAK